MARKEMYIASTDPRQKLHVVIWEGEGQAKAVLQIVHGMEEYADRYEAQAEAMVKLGWAVIAHDHLGHGHSGIYMRGHFTNEPNGSDIILGDIAKVSEAARDLWPDAPQYILGHSMGSFLVRRYLCLNSWNEEGAVIMGTGYYPSIETWLAWRAAKIASRLTVHGSKSRWLQRLCSTPMHRAFRKEGPDAWLSKNATNNAAFRTDPLRGFGFTNDSYMHMNRILWDVSRKKDTEKIRRSLPILLISGEDDPVGGKRAVEKLRQSLEKRKFSEVSSKIMTGDRHELYYESDASETIACVSKWLEAHRYASERKEEKEEEKKLRYEAHLAGIRNND